MAVTALVAGLRDRRRCHLRGHRRAEQDEGRMGARRPRAARPDLHRRRVIAFTSLGRPAVWLEPSSACSSASCGSVEGIVALSTLSGTGSRVWSIVFAIFSIVAGAVLLFRTTVGRHGAVDADGYLAHRPRRGEHRASDLVRSRSTLITDGRAGCRNVASATVRGRCGEGDQSLMRQRADACASRCESPLLESSTPACDRSSAARDFTVFGDTWKLDAMFAVDRCAAAR